MRFLTAGESHGPTLVGILEGMPAGLTIDISRMQSDLDRRRSGYGRGARTTKIESDTVQIVSGVRGGVTLGSPIALLIENKDWKNWKSVMSPIGKAAGREVYRPRPGHADLAGGLKYGFTDLRNALERASARETAMRVALGSLARQYLDIFGVDILSHVIQLGGIEAKPAVATTGALPGVLARLRREVEASPVRTADLSAGRRMVARIEAARIAGDTLGGVFEVLVTGLLPGLGAHAQWDRKLDGRLAAGLMSIPAIKGVEIGLGFAASQKLGTEVHDPILPAAGKGSATRYRRATNNAGGLEGGVTNGEPLVLRAAMKPISTTMKGLPSVDIRTGKPETSSVERSDVCALPAAGVVGEAVVALTLADAWAEKFGGDTMDDTRAAVVAFGKLLKKR
ncbi:MAG: chorismate synthase [Candidatus Eisenbacteria bacterium]|nr:chorismate synthase [Candidatus Eisenbacteria bacterium]